MSLYDKVHIAGRFRRSIRIDTDLYDPKSLEGYICPQSSAEVLLTMARHISETGQGAFTWTGAYGGGKSSLAVGLASILSGNRKLQQRAKEIFGAKVFNAVTEALPSSGKGWRILPVIGNREEPHLAVGRALVTSRLASNKPKGGWSQELVLDYVSAIANACPHESGGLVIFIDEMGKFLEGAVKDNSDVFFFQQLAELASRLGGRLRFVGILHQSFGEYANRLAREVRVEWEKVQGRFIDLSVNVTRDEQFNLISRAIETGGTGDRSKAVALKVATIIYHSQPKAAVSLAKSLTCCWPLHPVVVCLLGSISRRRFGQNQRSVFGFLNSVEVHGFQDFLQRASSNDLYNPSRMWDYLRCNLEASILASPDGHRWASAASVLDRCEAEGADVLEVDLLKTIAVADLFKEQSGLNPSIDLLHLCFSGVSVRSIKKTLAYLIERRLIIFKKFLNAYAVYAGSDFDIEKEMQEALNEIEDVDIGQLNDIAGLEPILAKRHYHDTGAMRWFDITCASLRDIENTIVKQETKGNAVGQFVLLMPSKSEWKKAERECRKIVETHKDGCLVVGMSDRSDMIISLALELLALERVRDTSMVLTGDDVARIEIEARIMDSKTALASEIHSAIDSAIWYIKGKDRKQYRRDELNVIASDISGSVFKNSPRLHNELLNRQKPSTSANSGRKALLHRMVLSEGRERLDIEGYSVERGLFESILDNTGLYQKIGEGEWRFHPPETGNKIDVANLFPAWKAALDHIKKKQDRVINSEEIYEIWCKPPFGIKNGLLPVFMTAFILAERSNIAVYREGLFRSSFNDVDVDYLAKSPGLIQLRWVELSVITKDFLRGLADITRDLGSGSQLPLIEPIDVARGLVAIYDGLPPWTKHTMGISTESKKTREIFKRAHDPNSFLFDDLPKLTGIKKVNDNNSLMEINQLVRNGLSELVHAYPKMLHQLRNLMLQELKVMNNSDQALSQLRERAENIRQVGGDFHLEAFIGRLSQFNGSDENIEGIASLAIHKSSKEWIDADYESAKVALSKLSEKFLQAETFAHVKGRSDKRQSIGLVIGLNDGKRLTNHGEFDVADSDKDEIDNLVSEIERSLNKGGPKQNNLILAALAHIINKRLTEVAGIGKSGDVLNSRSKKK